MFGNLISEVLMHSYFKREFIYTFICRFHYIQEELPLMGEFLENKDDKTTIVDLIHLRMMTDLILQQITDLILPGKIQWIADLMQSLMGDLIQHQMAG